MGAPIDQAGGVLGLLGIAGLLGTVAYLVRQPGNGDTNHMARSQEARDEAGPDGARASTTVSSQKLCSECGAAVEHEDTICPTCGASRELVCAQCGAECPRERRYCPECGSKVAIGLGEDR